MSPHRDRVSPWTIKEVCSLTQPYGPAYVNTIGASRRHQCSSYSVAEDGHYYNSCCWCRPSFKTRLMAHCCLRTHTLTPTLIMIHSRDKLCQYAESLHCPVSFSPLSCFHWLVTVAVLSHNKKLIFCERKQHVPILSSASTLSSKNPSACQCSNPSYPHSWTRPWSTIVSGRAPWPKKPRGSPCRFSLNAESHRTTSSANSREAVSKPHNRTFSTPQLRLKMLSMKVTNRTDDKRQLWRRPPSTGNMSDLMPRIWTQLLQSYKDRMAHCNGCAAPYLQHPPVPL